jgi:VIT1/CCC1 family predicted Fe2+/Mn2+ transporter
MAGSRPHILSEKEIIVQRCNQQREEIAVLAASFNEPLDSAEKGFHLTKVLYPLFGVATPVLGFFFATKVVTLLKYLPMGNYVATATNLVNKGRLAMDLFKAAKTLFR